MCFVVFFLSLVFCPLHALWWWWSKVNISVGELKLRASPSFLVALSVMSLLNNPFQSSTSLFKDTFSLFLNSMTHSYLYFKMCTVIQLHFIILEIHVASSSLIGMICLSDHSATPRLQIYVTSFSQKNTYLSEQWSAI